MAAAQSCQVAPVPMFFPAVRKRRKTRLPPPQHTHTPRPNTTSSRRDQDEPLFLALLEKLQVFGLSG